MSNSASSERRCQSCLRVLRSYDYGEMCRTCRVVHLRAANKRRAVAYLGGCCLCCGWTDPVALAFHHRDPKHKQFKVSGALHRSWEYIQKELDKCDLLCANCHLTLHAHEKTTLTPYQVRGIINLST